MTTQGGTMTRNNPFVSDENAWWQERLEAMSDEVQHGAATITHFARRTGMQDIAAGGPIPTWADLAAGDLYQTTADLINCVLQACDAADVDPDRVLELAAKQRA